MKLLATPAIIQFFSLAGALSSVLGALISGLAYRGRRGQHYSPLNHFISELGELGVSRLARAFNLGLVLCGLLLLPCSLGLGFFIPGLWSKIGMVAGCIAAVAVSLVGVYPMNDLTSHSRAAMTFFRAGLAMILFFTAAILFQPQDNIVLPRLVGLTGIPAVLSYATFLFYSRAVFKKIENPLAPLQGERPRIFGLALVEWLVFLTTIPWFFAVALGL
jgi:hypothetical membrane protein